MASVDAPVMPRLTGEQVLAVLPQEMKKALSALQQQFGGPLYLAGGVVRDLLRKHIPVDIDLTVAAGASIRAERLAELLGGTFVSLKQEEDTARVVYHNMTVDFSAYRQETATIVEDLRCRDLTINALAIRLDTLLEASPELWPNPVVILDPSTGLADLQQGVLRVVHAESFSSDPLRLLRVFRFAGTLGYTVEHETMDLVRRQCSMIATAAAERIAHELDLIMSGSRAYATVALMAECGLLWHIIPDLATGIGMVQPESHHLDVWNHSLETLRQAERVLAEPDTFFPAAGEIMAAYLNSATRCLELKWAALLHDLGKPATHALQTDNGNRITFYRHDQVGSQMFDDLARGLRWSNEQRTRVGRLIAEHMRPFHLANLARADGLTLRAAIRMIRKNEEQLPGLFVLAMADSLAGQGVGCIKSMEAELAWLYRHLEKIRQLHIVPQKTVPPLLTGNDLIRELHLSPGPLFKRILDTVEERRMTGEVTDRATALNLAKNLVDRQMSDRNVNEG
ncbi:CCA tRNA nucleotidyltransferase [Desulfobulbus oligotrophicus]|uniref:HD domain-containing protein n=1 Tax=Desulfobulbus oligotrophicus TaxID=1909699 RepID=A0A7T5VCG3_9BACT|nr:HD domain-containing protein [Desulfobulbus oligotrophicus]QQG65338.1 HD domain-containing protein [Desulfobulbus oligotrophicus]